MNMDIGTHAAGGLRFEHAVERSTGALRKKAAWPNAAVVGQHDVQPIFVQHVDRNAVEEIAVLAEHIGFGALTNEPGGGKHNHVLELLNRNV